VGSSDLAGDTNGGGVRLRFGAGTYFDQVDVCEAVAHELAAAGPGDPLPYRTLLGDPCDLTRRSVIPGVSVLTIRRGADPTFVLHHRDRRPSCTAPGCTR